MNDRTRTGCPLCDGDGGRLLVAAPRWRIVLADEPGWPGFARVIWNDHVAEMTDLRPEDRSELMRTVCRLEEVMRHTLEPDKVNLASLGNQVPHLHWHVIPRYRDDSHWPAPVWAPAARETRTTTEERIDRFREAVVRHFSH